ncbi:MAG: hypothetical protein IJ228_01230 [Succinivibrio sp.]|nr:hypothetical protein [Succinivibrio sp.]
MIALAVIIFVALWLFVVWKNLSALGTFDGDGVTSHHVRGNGNDGDFHAPASGTFDDWQNDPAYSHMPGNIWYSQHLSDSSDDSSMSSSSDSSPDYFTDPMYSYMPGNINHYDPITDPLDLTNNPCNIYHDIVHPDTSSSLFDDSLSSTGSSPFDDSFSSSSLLFDDSFGSSSIGSDPWS